MWPAVTACPCAKLNPVRFPSARLMPCTKVVLSVSAIVRYGVAVDLGEGLLRWTG